MQLLATIVLTAFFATAPKPPLVKSPFEMKARDFMTNFVAARYDAASKDFNESMRKTVAPATLAYFKSELDTQVGAFRSMGDFQQARDGGFWAMKFNARYDKFPVAFKIVFDADGQIGALFVNPQLPQKVDPALEAVAREFLSDISAARFDVAGKKFDEAMRRQLPPPRLAEFAKNLTLQFGAFRSINEVRQNVENDRRAVELVSTFERSAVSVVVVFDGIGNIAGVRIGPLTR